MQQRAELATQTPKRLKIGSLDGDEGTQDDWSFWNSDEDAVIGGVTRWALVRPGGLGRAASNDDGNVERAERVTCCFW